MYELLERQPRMQMDRGAAVKRERHRSCAAQRSDAQQLSDARAPGDVGLEHVDRTGLEHAPEVERVVAVLARGDLHAGGGPIAHQPQALEIVGGHRLLEPAHAGVVREAPCEVERLLARVGPVGVDEQLRVGSDRLARGAARRSGSSPGTEPTFILTRGIPSCTQPASCATRRWFEYDVNPPLPYTGTASRAPPQQTARAAARAAAPSGPRAPRQPQRSPSSRSPAGRGCESPSTIAAHAACGAIASRPRTTSASFEAISVAVETSA